MGCPVVPEVKYIIIGSVARVGSRSKVSSASSMARVRLEKPGISC